MTALEILTEQLFALGIIFTVLTGFYVGLILYNIQKAKREILAALSSRTDVTTPDAVALFLLERLADRDRQIADYQVGIEQRNKLLDKLEKDLGHRCKEYRILSDESEADAATIEKQARTLKTQLDELESAYNIQRQYEAKFDEQAQEITQQKQVVSVLQDEIARLQGELAKQKPDSLGSRAANETGAVGQRGESGE